jgi:polysaccharide biosynthesis transport protein
MSASVLRSPEFIRIETDTTVLAEEPRVARGWNPEDFAREQIRGLVRQLFFSSADRPVRQVVFSAVEAQSGVGDICRNVGECLARETQGSVAVVTRERQVPPELEVFGVDKIEPIAREQASSLHLGGIRVGRNLWFLAEDEIVAIDRQLARRTSLYSHVGDLRREFEYSIIEGLPASESSDAAALGQLADGIVLVLSAHATRRATARKVKEMLDAAAARILGTVLSDRTFPIPDGIYRRL